MLPYTILQVVGTLIVGYNLKPHIHERVLSIPSHERVTEVAVVPDYSSSYCRNRTSTGMNYPSHDDARKELRHRGGGVVLLVLTIQYATRSDKY